MRKIYFFLLVISTSKLISQSIDIALIASGFSNPICIENAGDDRMFIAEKSGVIKILDATNTTLSTPFLNISSQVTNSGERGFLGLAFHPNYATNGYFYVNYSNNNGDNVISRFSATSPTSNTADSNSEVILLTISQPYSNHNGGDIAFGPDGYLYIATGDGGSGGDPLNNSQNTTNLLGKLLRIDVDNTTGSLNYAIPSDNPFYGSTSNAPEIWAYGLRNPWRFSFDSQTGELWIADVGQNQYEEINFASSTEAGINYGWRCYEGNANYNTSGCAAASTMHFPVAVYSHSNSGAFKCSITGGFRHRGNEQTTLNGLYFFADYCSGEIGILAPNGSNWNYTFTTAYSDSWVSFGENLQDEIYIAGSSSGAIYKIIDENLNVSENAVNSSFTLYPNPAKDFILVNVKNTISIKKSTLYSIDGKKVSRPFQSTIVNNTLKITISNLPSGIYFLEMETQTGQQITKKFVKL